MKRRPFTLFGQFLMLSRSCKVWAQVPLMRNNGFSLVELSVVLVVIALLMGTVAGGRKLVEKVEMNAIIADFQKISDAVKEFEDRYQQLPGDLDNVSKLPTQSPVLTAGDGNGYIDYNPATNTMAATPVEALYFWRHLNAAKLITGNFDGSSQFVPAGGNTAGGVYAGKIKGSGYKVYYDPTVGTVVEFSLFSSTSSTLAVFTPEKAWYIDKALDDGNPTTGIVRATAGQGQTATNCVNSGSYALSYKGDSCILRLTIIPKSAASSETLGTCNGSAPGTIRNSPTASCPSGYRGTVKEVCVASDNGLGGAVTGAWRTLRNDCERISCDPGKFVGDTRTIDCPTGCSGTLRQTCRDTGLWEVTADDSYITDNTSTCAGMTSRTLPCPIGYAGVRVQECYNGTWRDYSTCNALIACSGKNVGAAETTASGTCPAYYTGTSTKACTMPVTSVTSVTNPAGTWTVTTNSCLPVYGSGCTAGTTRNIGCPNDQVGSPIQKCNSAGYWEPAPASAGGTACAPATCDGKPLGYVRTAAGKTCPIGQKGTVLEVCSIRINSETDHQTYWQTTLVNCGDITCPPTDATNFPDYSGNAQWPAGKAISRNSSNLNSIAYDTVVTTASSCAPGGYTAVAPMPKRICQLDGTWSAPDTACDQPPKCPLSTDTGDGALGYAKWLATDASTTAKINFNGYTCIDDYAARTGLEPTRTCSAASTWGAVSGTCFEGMVNNQAAFCYAACP